MSDPEGPPQAIEVTFAAHRYKALPSPRDLTASERQLIDRMIAHDPSVGLAGQRQASLLRVVEDCDECRSLVFSAGPSPPLIPSRNGPNPRWGVVGLGGGMFLAPDTDGIQVFAVLHVAEGVITNLELARDDGEPITELPPPDEFQLDVLPGV